MALTYDELYDIQKKRKKKKKEDNGVIASYNNVGNKPTITRLKDDRDIAPVLKTFTPKTTVAPTVTTKSKKKKKDDDRTWFQKGAFADGYDFGDVTKTILGSVTDIGENLGTGILGMGEKVVDSLAMMGTAMNNAQMSQLSNDELAFSSLKNIGKDKKTKEKEAESIVKKYTTAQKDAKKGATEIVKKDLYDEEKIAKKIISAPVRNLTGIDAEASSVFGEKSDSLVQSGGQLLATAGLNMVGMPWFLTTGLTSYGAESENALKQGATFEQASMSATISAGAEVLLEKVSGGIKFGGNTLDDIIVKPFVDKIANKFVKKAVELGVDALGEAGEEWWSENFSRIGQWLTYQDDKSLAEMLWSEEAMDSKIEAAIGGGLLGGFANGVRAVANRNKIELTENEQKVVDKVVEDRIAEIEESGEKLSDKDKEEIRARVTEDLERGYITTDEIESTLSEEEYKAFKEAYDKEKALKDERKALGEKESTTLNEKARFEELNELIKEAEENTNTLRGKVESKVFPLIGNSKRLTESYLEADRGREDFKADYKMFKGSKHEDAARKTIENAIKSKANNSNRVRDLVNMNARFSAETGIVFEYKTAAEITNDFIERQTAEISKIEGIPEAQLTEEQIEDLADMKEALEDVKSGKLKVNGNVTSDSIVINLNSSNVLESISGHEITHLLEKAKSYEKMRDALFSYAKMKGVDIYAEVIARKLTYKGVKDSKAEAELVADLIGDYIFTDYAFVEHLANTNRNVFQKLYDSVKHLCKMATAGSKEARELEKVRRNFEKALNESAKSGVKVEGTQNSLSAEQEEYFKDSKVRDENGNLKVMYHGTSKGGHTVFDTYGSNYGLMGTGSYFTDNKSVAESYTNKGKGDNKQVYESYLNITNPLDMDAQANPEEWAKAFEDVDFPESGTNEQFYRAVEEYCADDMMTKWEAADFIRESIEFGMGYDGITHIGGGRFNKKDETRHRVYIAFEPEQIKNIDNVAPTKDADIRYSLSTKNGAVIVDDSNKLQPIANISLEDYQSLFNYWNEDENIQQLAETVFTKLIKNNEKKEESAFYSPTLKAHLQSAEQLRKYTYSSTTRGMYSAGRKGLFGDSAPLGIYLNVDAFNDDSMYGSNQQRANTILHEAIHAATENAITSVEVVLKKQNQHNDFYDALEFEAPDNWSDELKGGLALLQIYEQFDASGSLKAKHYGFKNAHEMVAELSNPDFRAELKQRSLWDRVVDAVKKILGIKPKNGLDATTKALEQILGAETDIRYSLTEDSEGNKLTKKQSEYFANSKAVDRDGNLLKVYHTTKNDFTVFDKGRKGEATEDANTYLGFFFSDDAEYMQNFPEFENGKTESYYLDMKNPIDMTDISREAFMDIVEVMGGDVGDASILFDEELEAAHNRAKVRGDNNVSLQLGHLLDELTGEFYYDDFIRELKPHYDELMSKGYDGVINYMDELFGVKEYIVLDSNQAKLTSNKNPSADADVRYSLSTEYTPQAKSRKTMKPTNSNLQKDMWSVRDVRSKTMLENNYTQADVEQVNKFMDNLATFMEKAGVTYKFIGLEDVNNAKVKVVYDTDGTPKRITMSAMVKNGEYPVNFDFTTICKKRQSMSMVIEELARRKNGDGVRALDEIDLDAKALWTINEELRKAGLETACLGCFVESKRYNIQRFSDKAASMWNSIVDEVRQEQGNTQPVEKFNFAEGVDLEKVNYAKVDKIFKAYRDVKDRTSPEKRMRALIKNGGEMYQKYLQPSDLMTPEGIEGLKSLSTSKNDFYGIIKGVYGQAAPKEVMSFSPYNSEIALLPDKKGKNMKMAEYIAKIGGVRMQSFSDFIVSNVYDYMQMVADLSAKHLPAHAYTKEIAFARIFGKTGIKINMSVMFDIDPSLPPEYAGLQFIPDVNGTEEYDGVKGRFEYLVADQKRSDKVLAETGERPYVQSIGFDEAVELQNKEGYSGNIGIIGVGYSDKHIIKMLRDNNIRYVIPYHSSSLPAEIKEVANIPKEADYTEYQNTKTKSGDALIGLGGFDIYKDVAKTKNPKQTAQNYLDYCKSKNYTPVFPQFAEEENYYKLLFDFDPYDTITGEYSPQTEVKNIYEGYNPEEGLTSTEEIERLIEEEMKIQNEANRQRNTKISDVVDSVLEQLGVESNKVGFSLSEEGQKSFVPYGRSGLHGSDFTVQNDIAPVTEGTVSKTEKVGTVNEDDLENSIKGERRFNDELNYDYWIRTLTEDDFMSESVVQEDIAPTKEYEAIKPRPDVLSDDEKQWAENKMSRADTEEKPTRAKLHSGIVEGIRTKFAEKGSDLDEVLNKAKNLSTFKTVDNIPQRVMEKALGYKEGQILADETVNKVAQNESEGIKWLNSFTDRKNGILAQISKQYGIKPRSKKSAAAQMYAEGFYVNEKNEIIEYGDRELAIDFPDVRVQERIKGLARDERIRQIYDETLEAINESRRRNLYPEIQRLDNYFLHFRAMDDTFSRLGLPFNPNDIRAKDLPTDLNGVTADLKPGQPYFASAMHRTGKRTSFDLLGGLEKYLTSAKNQIYHIDDIQTLRALRNYIADTYGQAKGLESLDSLSEEEAQERIEQVYGSHLSTFAKFLNEEANVLAGKTALIDRGLEGIIGRRGITFLNTINGQVGSNMVGWNISSSLTNFLPVAQTLAKGSKVDFTKAFAQTVSSKIGSIFGKTDSFVENNPTIIRRKGAERFYRTPFQKIGDTGYLLMSAVDNVSTELIVRTKYNELIRKGMDEQKASFEADKWVSRLMGDRSLGQMPQLYNSKMLGLITKFQLEVRNQLDSQFYDTIQEAKVSNEEIENKLLRNGKTAAKVTSVFLQLAVVQHLYGMAFESIAGYNPAFDIIDVLIKALGFDDDEEDEDTTLDNLEEGFFALLEDLPYTSTFTGGRIPISSALPIKELIKGEDQYGNEVSRAGTLKETAPYYLLPTGYGQIKKTAKGLAMFSDEHPVSGSYTDSGNLRFPVEDNLKNRVQAGVFGQYANKNARTYFDEGYAPLKEKQIKEYDESKMPIEDYWKYRKGLSKLKKQDEKVNYINGLKISDDQKNVLKSYLYDEEGYKEENPEKYAFLEREGIGYLGYKEADEDTQSAWSWAFKHQDEYEYYKENGVYPGDYSVYHVPMLDFDDEGDEAYQWAFDNPVKASFGKVFDSGVKEYRQYSADLYELKGDKNSKGQTISGSAKAKKRAYIWSLPIDEGQKIILYRSLYDSKKDKAAYNRKIVNYLESRDDISYDEMFDILEELDFTVDRDTGRISW